MYTNELREELSLRWNKIRQAMLQTGVEACLLSGTVNLLYISGRVFNGCFYLPVEGEPIFFVKRPFGLTEGNVVYIRKPEDIPAILNERRCIIPKSVGLESDFISFSEQVRLSSLFPNSEIRNVSGLMRSVRAVKTPMEVSMYRKACTKHAEVMRLVPECYRPGMTDLEFNIAIENLFRTHGAMGVFRAFGPNMEIFMGSILAGDNAMAASPYDFAMGGAGIDPSLPIGSCNRVIESGESVMVDMGGTFSPYISDMTRTFSVGKLSELAYKAHEVSIDIVHKIKDHARSGTACSELYILAFEKAKEEGLADYFMGYGQQAAFVGHGVGLEINELPVLFGRSKERLQANNIIAVEPKFVIPGVGAVGIENTFLVHETGLEKLTVLDEAIIDLTAN
ncbi:MAG: M24 family metallopeptidase [Bacteroidales bacterium]